MALLMTLGRGNAMSTPDALPPSPCAGGVVQRVGRPGPGPGRADRTSCIHRARFGQKSPARVDGPVRPDALFGIQANCHLGTWGLISIG
jgi:hypothetical protein